MTPIPLTRQAAAFAAKIDLGAAPAKAIEVARLGFADTLACILAGRDEPATGVVRAYAERALAKGNVPALLGTTTTTPEGAGLIDATAAHALDFDDYAFANHVSAVLVPVAMAGAWGAPDGSGARMVAAYLAGYEIWAQVMQREPDHLHSKGWHPTAVFGPIGAAAAASVMAGLDEDATANALAIATSHAGGVMANFGSMTKPYHAGIAAEAGLRAVALTRAGLSAQPVALENDVGLMRALSPNGRVDLTRPAEFGTHWEIEKSAINIKKYPTVGASQRCIDAMLALADRADIASRADAIVRIVPGISQKHAAVMRFSDPRNPAEAKFSLQFACAAALLHGRLGLAEMTQGKLDDPKLRALMAKVEIDAHDTYDPDYPVAAPFDVVTITMNDGSTYQTPEIRRASGHADAPLTRERHWTKFADCAGHAGLDEKRARALFDNAYRIETLSGPEALIAPAGR